LPAASEGYGAPTLGGARTSLSTLGAVPLSRSQGNSYASPEFRNRYANPESWDSEPGHKLDLWELQKALRPYQIDASVRDCGTEPAWNPDGLGIALEVRRNGEHVRASWRGLKRCDSVHACPTCNRRISLERAEVLQASVAAHRSARGDESLLMVTLTNAHRHDDSLAEMRRAQPRIWVYVKGHRRFRAWCKAHGGLVGQVRATEVTHGINGWHPHQHVLLYLGEDVSDTAREELEALVFELWCAGTIKYLGGRHLPTREHGVDVRPCYRDTYLCKMGLGLSMEIADPGTKSGIGLHRSIWQIAADIVRYGRPEDIALFQEYCAAMRGCRQLCWGRGKNDVRAIYGVTATEHREPEGEHWVFASLSEFEWSRIAEAGAERECCRAAEEAVRGSPERWRRVRNRFQLKSKGRAAPPRAPPLPETAGVLTITFGGR